MLCWQKIMLREKRVPRDQRDVMREKSAISSLLDSAISPLTKRVSKCAEQQHGLLREGPKIKACAFAFGVVVGVGVGDEGGVFRREIVWMRKTAPPLSKRIARALSASQTKRCLLRLGCEGLAGKRGEGNASGLAWGTA